MSGVLTRLVVELTRSAAARTRTVVEDAVGEAGGSLTPLADHGSGDGTVLVAAFPLAMDAARAAVGIVRSTKSTDHGFRGFLDTGDDAGEVATTAAVKRLRQARPGQLSVSAQSAVLVGPLLPPDVRLTEATSTPVGPNTGAERRYELGCTSPDASPTRLADAEGGLPDEAASNLGWARRAAGPLLGRESATAALDAAWTATLRGERRHVLVTGEGGIGKTAVAADLALRVHARRGLVLYGRWDRDQIIPYQAFREAFGWYADCCPVDHLRTALDSHYDAIARLLPDVAVRLGDRHPTARGDAEGERLAVYEAVHTWLDRLAARRPVLLVLDDLHWAERSSLLQLDHLRHTASRAPWMLLTTSRAPEPDGLGGAPVDRVELGGLGADAVARLVGERFGAGLRPDDEAIAWLTGETAGNPLLIHHILASLTRATPVRRALHDAREHLPEHLRDVIRWRLAQLPAATFHLVTDAAVVDTTIDLDLLGAATDRPPVHLRQDLEPALAEELVRLDPDTDRYHFTHEVVRRTLADDADDRRADDLHRAVAQTLEALAAAGHGVQASKIAHHYLVAVDPTSADAAIRWARRGAEVASRATGFDEAVVLLRRAVAVHDRYRSGAARDGTHVAHDAPGDALGCELRLELARAHDQAGQFTARDDRHVEAATMARTIGRSDLFAEAALGYGGRLPAAPIPNPAARSLLEEAIGYLPAGDSEHRSLILARLAHVRHFDAPYLLRKRWADDAVAMARRMDSPAVLAAVLVAWCLALEGSPTYVDDALATSDEVISIGERLDDHDLRLQGIRLRVPALFAIGQHRDARQMASTYAQMAARINHEDHLRLATMWDILWAGLDGDVEKVETMVESLGRHLDEAGHSQGAVIRFAYTFIPRWLSGQLERTRSMLDALLAIDPEATIWWAASACLDTVTGHIDVARARLDQRDPVATVEGLEHDFMRLPTLATLAVTASSGDAAWAEAVYQALLPAAGQLGLAGYAVFVGAVDHYLGTLAYVLGRREEAVARLESAMVDHRALDAPPFMALTACWLAQALRARGQPGDAERAETLRDEVESLAEQFPLGGLPVLDDPAIPTG